MTHSSESVEMQFDTLAQQHQADTLGMWVFLSTEILFFGGLFFAYSVYRWFNPAVFVAASQELNLTAGTINTAVLMSSSLTMALADFAISANRRRILQVLLTATALLGLVFLGIKGYEYYQEYNHQLIPFINDTFGWDKAQPERAKLFFNLYFIMTGLHAIHLFIGCCLLGVMLMISRRSRNPARLQSQVKLSALYWHFVDIVWVFLFPLLYLAR